MSAYNNIKVYKECPKCGKKFELICQAHVASSFDGDKRGRFYGKVRGKDVVFFVFKDGKHSTQIATSVIPTIQQMVNWGLK